MKTIIALLLAAEVSAAQAAAMPSFEQSLGQFRQDFLAQRAAQRKVKALAAPQEIDALASSSQRMRFDAQRLRDNINDARWRAQRSHPGDQWLRSDLQRLTWNLRDFARYTQDLAWRARSILGGAQKDPACVAPAQRLQGSSSWLRSEMGWLQMDAQSAGWDFRRAGYSMEAFEVENAARDAENSANDLERLAAQILAKVKP